MAFFPHRSGANKLCYCSIGVKCANVLQKDGKKQDMAAGLHVTMGSFKISIRFHLPNEMH